MLLTSTSFTTPSILIHTKSQDASRSPKPFFSPPHLGRHRFSPNRIRMPRPVQQICTPSQRQGRHLTLSHSRPIMWRSPLPRPSHQRSQKYRRPLILRPPRFEPTFDLLHPLLKARSPFSLWQVPHETLHVSSPFRSLPAPYHLLLLRSSPETLRCPIQQPKTPLPV
jgi:hypothetical protein